MRKFYFLLLTVLFAATISNAQTFGILETTAPNNTAATAQAITSPAKVKGNVFPNADVDFYSFTATAGDKVYAAVITSFSSSSSSDAQLRLIASDGVTVIEFDDDDGSFGSLSSSIAGAVIPSSGTYYLQVNHFSTTSQLRNYDLYLKVQSGSPTAEVESNDTPATANAMPGSGWVSGARNPAAATEQDWFSVTLAAGESVFISADWDPERDAVTYNGRLGFALFGDAANQILVVDDASTTSPNSETFVFTAKNAGTYYVFADAASAATGGPTATYNISFVKFTPETGYVNYASSDIPKTIGPGAGSVTSTLTIPDSKLIKDLSVRINLTHALMADIDATLTAPNGTVIHLFTDIGASATGGQTQMDAVFNDNAAIPPSFTVLTPIVLQPEIQTKLDMLKGVNTAGVWTLTLYDDGANASGGTLNSWSLDVQEFVPPSIVGATVIANEDFEASDGGFTHSGTQDEWARGTPSFAPITTANSGVNCWKTDLANTYNASCDQTLSSPAYVLPAGSNPIWLSWAMKYQLESRNFDSLRVYVEEVGNPANYRTLFDWMGATSQASIGNPSTSTNFAGGWGTHWVDISSFAGLSIQFKVKLASDASGQYAGAAIDDIKIYQLCSPSSITLGTSPVVCSGSTSANLPYTATTGTPDQYSIDYNPTAEGAGFVDVVNAVLPASPITLTVPAGAPAATYNATITVIKAVGGCVSPAVPFTVTVNATPTVYSVTGGGTYCGAGGVPVGLSGSQPGVDYQLYIGASPTGAPVAGTGAAISFGNQTAGTYTVVATNTATLCTSNMTGSAIATSATAPVVNAPTVTQPTIPSPTGTIVVNATGGPTLEYSVHGIGGPYQLSNTFTGLAPGASYDIVVRLQNSTACEVSYSGNPVVLNSVNGRVTDVLVGSSPFQDSLWTINLADYSILRRLGPTLSGYTITGMNGIATNPLTGEHFMIAKVSGGPRRLVKVNVQTGVCTDIGSMGDNFSTLAFKTNGELYSVTGNGAAVPETMYKIDTLTGGSTLYRTLGNGADGEVIAFNPDDNFFYHWSGNGTVIWEKFANDIDPILPLTTNVVSGEVFGALYAGSGKFWISNISSTIRYWDIPTETASPVLMNTPDDLRGLVRESCASSITAGGPTTICSGSNVLLTVNGGTGNYQWYLNGAPIGGANSSTYAAGAAGLYNCIYTDGCNFTDSVSLGITISLYPTADATATPASQAACSGTAITTIALTGSVSGTTFNWTRDNTGTVTGIAANGSGDISGTLTNTTAAPVTVTFTITPTANGCAGTPTTATVTVNPPPTVDPVADQTVCNGGSTSPVNFTGPVAGTVFNWTNNNTSIGLAASGSGNIPSFVGTNATNAPVSGTITVTPSITYSGTQTFNYTGAMQTWTVPAGVTSVFIQTWGGQGGSGALGGASVSGGSGGLGGYAEGNLAVTPGQVLNIFVGGQGATPLGGFNGGGNGGSVNAGGGGGASDVRVGGIGVANRVITAGGGGGGGRGGCHESSGTGGIGGNGGSGGGGVGQNGNDSPQSSGVAGGGFGGNFANVQGALGAAGIGCSGFLGSPGVATATEIGGNGGSGQACCCFTSNSVPGGGGGGGGQIGGGGAGGGSAGTTGCSGNSKGAGGGGGGGSSYTGGVTAGVTNSGIWLGNGMVSISYASITCTGTPTTFNITVNPTPTITPVSDQVVCNGAAIPPVNFTVSTTGGINMISWTNSNPAIGIPASGTGNIFGFTATNATNAPISGTITVTPQFSNNSVVCTGPSITYTVTVNPTATVDPVSNQTVCNGGSTTAVNFSSPTTGGTIVYNWTNSNPAIGLAASGSGNIPSFVGTNATNAPITGTITVTPTYTNGVSCVGTPMVFTITVNPIPNAVIVGTPGSIQVIITGNGSWADEITWTLRNSLNAVILSGGPYGFNPPATPSAIVPATNAPFTFFIEAQGTFNDNACTWEVRCNGNVVASGCIRGTNNGTACGSVGTLTVSNISGCSNNPSPQTVCSGSPIIPIPFSSNVAGTVFNWTRDNQVNVTGLPNSGTGTITGTPINNTNVAQTVTFTITPSYTNNGVTCTGTPITATVIVNKAPTITCPANITVNSQPGLCGAAVLFPAATATGAPAPVITYSHFSGAVFPVGTTTVTATATNSCGVATCTFTITVIDVEPPVITCPAPIVVSNDPNQCGAVVNYSVGVADNCQKFQVPVTILPHGGGALTVAGNNLPGGFYFDLTNNSATPKTIKSLMVRFGSNAFGAVSSPAPVSVYVTTSATTYVGNTNTAGAWTAIGTNIPVTVGGPNSEFSLVPLPGNGFTLAPGATKGIYLMGTAASLVYNSAANSSFTPISNGVLTVTPGQASSALFVGAGSPRTPNVIINYITLTQTAGLPSGSFFPIGTTTNTFTATDDAGNTSASCSFTVRVNDTQAPTITCPGNITVTTPVGSCTAVVNYTVTASDNCPGVTTQLIAGLASGSAFPIGITTVTWRATDAAGNLSAPCSFTVTVIDAQLPVISQQPVSVSVCAGENASFSVTSSNAVSYQWQLFDGNNWNNIPGATGSTLTLTNVTIGMNGGAYRVRVIGLCTTVNSNPATLTVKPLPTIVLTASRPPVLLPGQSLTITAVVSPGGGTFVWRKNGNVIAGASTDQLTGLTVDDAGSYTCTYTLNGCSVTSAVMVVSAQQSGNIYVYPNPNYGQFEVRFYNQTGEAVTLTVYNVLGQMVYQKAFGTGLPYSHMDVNLGNMSQGSYLVAVVNGAGQIVGAKWIIVYKY